MGGFFVGLTRGALVFGMAVAMTLVAPGAGRADSLRAAMSDAYVNSALLEQNRFLLRLDDEGVAQAVAQLRPTLSFVASANRDLVADTTTATASLVAEWVLYAGNSRRLAIEAARETVLAARQGLVDVEQQVLRDAVTAYLNVWRDLQVVNVREANVRVVTQQLRAARDRFEVGEDTRTDVAQAEARLAQARSALAAARGQLEISRELFALAVGRYPGALAGPGPVPGLPRSEEEADGLARQNAPSILRLQHEVTAAELAVQGARASYRPTITLDGRATNTFESPFPGGEGEGASIGLTLTQPIYRGGQLASLERQALRPARCAPRSISRHSSTFRSWATHGPSCESPMPRSRLRISRSRLPNWPSRAFGKRPRWARAPRSTFSTPSRTFSTRGSAGSRRRPTSIPRPTRSLPREGF